MARIKSALFAPKQKPGTRDKKKRQTRFDLEPDSLTRELFRKVFSGATQKFVPIVHPDQAKLMEDLMEGYLTTDKWTDEEDLDFKPEELQ